MPPLWQGPAAPSQGYSWKWPSLPGVGSRPIVTESYWNRFLNTLAPRRCASNFKSVIFKLILQTDILSICSEIFPSANAIICNIHAHVLVSYTTSQHSQNACSKLSSNVNTHLLNKPIFTAIILKDMQHIIGKINIQHFTAKLIKWWHISAFITFFQKYIQEVSYSISTVLSIQATESRKWHIFLTAIAIISLYNPF